MIMQLFIENQERMFSTIHFGPLQGLLCPFGSQAGWSTQSSTEAPILMPKPVQGHCQMITRVLSLVDEPFEFYSSRYIWAVWDPLEFGTLGGLVFGQPCLGDALCVLEASQGFWGYLGALQGLESLLWIQERFSVQPLLVDEAMKDAICARENTR